MSLTRYRLSVTHGLRAALVGRLLKLAACRQVIVRQAPETHKVHITLPASLSGTVLQTPSIAFRHLPPNSEHPFPVYSSKLRASLSGIFLQTPTIHFRHLHSNSEHRFPVPSLQTPSIPFRYFPVPSSKLRASLSGTFLQTPSIAFRHLHPNSARNGYATEGALFISAQMSTDAVSALRKVRVLI